MSEIESTRTEQTTETPAVAAWEAASYIQVGVPGVPYSAIRVPLPESPIEAAAWIDRLLKAAQYLARKYGEAFPEPTPPERPQRAQATPAGAGRPSAAAGSRNRPESQQRRPSGQRGRQAQGRADRFEAWEGEDNECDLCGGPLGIYPRTGQMPTDKLVCLSRCRDGDFVHTVRWLSEDEDAAPF